MRFARFFKKQFFTQHNMKLKITLIILCIILCAASIYESIHGSMFAIVFGAFSACAIFYLLESIDKERQWKKILGE